MKRAITFIYVIPALATLLGIFGQSLSYLLYEHIAEVPPIYYLSALTGFSIFLYLMSPLSSYILFKKKKIRKEDLATNISINVILALPTSLWSLFVLIMWWG